LSGILALLAIEVASALLNGAGVINIVFHFVIIAEPFMLILALISIPMSSNSIEQLRTWLMRFGLINLFFAYVQKFILHLDGSGADYDPDNIKGVFIGQGAGHVIGGSISILFATYYFMTTAKTRPMWIRVSVVAASLIHVIISDTKQVLFAFGLGFVLLILIKLNNIKKAIIYLTATIVLGSAFFWAIYHIEALSAYNVWIRPEIYGPDGEATKVKMCGVRIVLSHYHSPFNWLFGLGPGHTIGRLGGWMAKDYIKLLAPVGGTVYPVGQAVWQCVALSWLANGTSLFSPFFGWAGIWGDLGFLGLGTYLYLSYLVWHRLCRDDFCKLFLLNIFVFGLIETQMEEPGYMLYAASLIALRWQERQRSI